MYRNPAPGILWRIASGQGIYESTSMNVVSSLFCWVTKADVFIFFPFLSSVKNCFLYIFFKNGSGASIKEQIIIEENQML